MEYTKPKVTIDLEEYNALLKAKSEKYDPDEVARLAATIAVNMNETADIKYLTEAICRDVDYTIILNIMPDHRGTSVSAKVIKKPIR